MTTLDSRLLTLDSKEWLEADQLGGFAMGTAGLIRTRRYHALLCCATAPPTGRMVLVAGLEVWAGADEAPIYLSSQRYGPDVIHPDGRERLVEFDHEPWPRWRFDIGGGHSIEHSLFCHRPSGEVVLRWRASGASTPLAVRPLLACRDYHGLARFNQDFDFDAEIVAGNASWRPYAGCPAITALSSGRYQQAPTWYRNFLYSEEQARGLDAIEDLGSPGVFRFDLAPGADAVLVLRAGRSPYGDAPAIAADHESAERSRRGDPVERAVDAYLVRRGRGLTVVAGYPWFTDWGRDTFIAIRGLCLQPGRPAHRLDQGRQVLLAWADEVLEIGAGMVPNRFTDGAAPELNAVDASLWFVVAAGELLERGRLSAEERKRIAEAVVAIVETYRRGARYQIRCDDDGLIAAGEPGVQLTWMDAKVGDRVVTPRIGKPVEIQALWINALAVAEVAGVAAADYAALRERAIATFRERFPLPGGGLADVIDVDHRPGVDDHSVRPNQIFAVGGLPRPILEGDAARRLVDLVEERLWTPMGPRTLDPADPAYAGSCEGGVNDRDSAYHQGTVWPWLAGPFIEAWVRSRGDTPEARAEAARRFVEPLWAQREVAGLGHISEIADGDAPHAPRGTPFQAWSLSELLRARLLCQAETQED